MEEGGGGGRGGCSGEGWEEGGVEHKPSANKYGHLCDSKLENIIRNFEKKSANKAGISSFIAYIFA